MNALSRLKHAFNIFNVEENYKSRHTIESSSYSNPHRARFSRGNERTIVTSVYNRLAIDTASLELRHVRLEDGRFKDYMGSNLDNCLSIEANIDQTSRNFIQDVVISMLDEGCVAVVPTVTTDSPLLSNSYDILELRTGKIIEWYPTKVKMMVYNDSTGRREELTLPKKQVAIIENPLYAVMNEYNSTMQRLIRKLSLMDSVDEETSSGNLDLLIQLPYAIKTEARKAQAEERRKDIEKQLNEAKYGVAYIDGTEHVTQLNRPVENNLMKQVQYLTDLLYSQLGLTQSILDGTADENTMNNYFTRTIEPIIGAIADEFHRKFISKTGRTQGQAIIYFRDPFKLIPMSQMADIADKFTRNEIISSNEMRQSIGMKPSKDPAADELRNKNLKTAADQSSDQSNIEINSKKEETNNE